MGFIRIIFDKTQHRTKNNLNFVFSGVQKFLCLEFPGTVHVICFCKECAVDADFRKCVKSFTHQNNMLLDQEFFIDIKRPGENIILPEQCACSILIGTVKWIFYFPAARSPESTVPGICISTDSKERCPAESCQVPFKVQVCMLYLPSW